MSVDSCEKFTDSAVLARDPTARRSRPPPLALCYMAAIMESVSVMTRL